MKPRGGEGQNGRLKCPLGFLVWVLNLSFCWVACKITITGISTLGTATAWFELTKLKQRYQVPCFWREIYAFSPCFLLFFLFHFLFFFFLCHTNQKAWHLCKELLSIGWHNVERWDINFSNTNKARISNFQSLLELPAKLLRNYHPKSHSCIVNVGLIHRTAANSPNYHTLPIQCYHPMFGPCSG